MKKYTSESAADSSIQNQYGLFGSKIKSCSTTEPKQSLICPPKALAQDSNLMPIRLKSIKTPKSHSQREIKKKRPGISLSNSLAKRISLLYNSQQLSDIPQKIGTQISIRESNSSSECMPKLESNKIYVPLSKRSTSQFVSKIYQTGSKLQQLSQNDIPPINEQNVIAKQPSVQKCSNILPFSSVSEYFPETEVPFESIRTGNRQNTAHNPFKKSLFQMPCEGISVISQKQIRQTAQTTQSTKTEKQNTKLEFSKKKSRKKSCYNEQWKVISSLEPETVLKSFNLDANQDLSVISKDGL